MKRHGVGVGSTGSVYRIGNVVFKNGSCRGKATLEGEIYLRYRGRQWIARGRPAGAMIELEYFPNVAYRHSVPKWRRWVFRDIVTRQIAVIRQAMTELAHDGVTYGDLIHCGLRQNGELALFDFSAARYSTTETATAENGKSLHDFITDFAYRPREHAAT